MPLAMSNANFTAWFWSTTRAEEQEEKDDGAQTNKEVEMSSIYSDNPQPQCFGAGKKFESKFY